MMKKISNSNYKYMSKKILVSVALAAGIFLMLFALAWSFTKIEEKETISQEESWPNPVIQNQQTVHILKDAERETQLTEDYSNTNNWTTYINPRYGFQLEYPEAWFVIEKDEEHLILSNYQTTFMKPDSPDDLLAIIIEIFPKNDVTSFENFEMIRSDYKNIADQELSYLVSDNKQVNLYIIHQRHSQPDNSWGMILPSGKAFLEDDNYGYLFSMATEIPSGTQGQEEELTVLKEILSSLEF